MVFRRLENNELDLEIMRFCVENSGNAKYSYDNAKFFLERDNAFFFVVFEDENAVDPMAFAYGWVLPIPEESMFPVYIYGFEVMKGYENKGAGMFLMANLRTFFFYDFPCSDMMFLCGANDATFISLIEKSKGVALRDIIPCFVTNDNLDENGNWKGTPEDGVANIEFLD